MSNTGLSATGQFGEQLVSGTTVVHDADITPAQLAGVDDGVVEIRAEGDGVALECLGPGQQPPQRGQVPAQRPE